jgi:hypothetical protein
MLSIIQGVALADLAGVVSANYHTFTFVHWLLVATELAIIGEIWTHFMTDATSKGWIPGYADSVLFFGLGVGELFLNHAIVLGLTAWLFGMAGAALAGLVTLAFIRGKEERDVENAVLLNVLRKREPLHRWHSVAGIAVFGLGFVVCTAASVGAQNLHGGKAAIAIVYGLLSLGWVLALIAITATHWQAILHYAHTGSEPDSLRPRMPTLLR